MAERAVNTADKRLVKTATMRVGACIRHHGLKGLIRSKSGIGQHIVWRIASETAMGGGEKMDSFNGLLSP